MNEVRSDWSNTVDIFFFFLAEMLTQKEETRRVEFLKKNLYTLRITADIFTFGLSYLADR